MPVWDWFKPPRNLLVILLLLTLGSVSALSWFGWKLLEQERIVEAQRTQDRLEQAADRVAANLRANLAETGERLSTWAASQPSGRARPQQGLLLVLTQDALSAYPPERLLYYPIASREPEAAAKVFAEGEALEFGNEPLEKAADIYRRLAESKDIAVQAGAWMRLGRVLRKAARYDDSRAAYERLMALAGVRVAGAPAELVARHAVCDLSGDRTKAEALKKHLLAGRWQLTRGQFEFYWSEAGRLSGREESIPEDALALAEVAALIWADWKREPSARGQRTVWSAGRPWFLIWRGGSGRRAVLAAEPESVLKQACTDREALCAAVDADGRLLAGRREGPGRAVVRTAAEGELPWTLYVMSVRGGQQASLLARQRFVLVGVAVMVVFLIAGTYFIARAIRKEIEVSRLQSDFVSAVSHEFRSPLTSMRQLSEILAEGRAPSDERRQRYYETLVGESRRLQRLVETILNFGKMEAGARQYRFEKLDAGELVERVVAEFEPQIAAAGRRIELSSMANGCGVEADPEALSLAVCNLVDNALKYSPGQPTVWVECACETGALAIRVRDQGMGIAPSEQKAIFRKFVRGSAAVAANVRGTGVGLAMVRHIVAAHGGRIQVASEPGQGSTFTILLPTTHHKDTKNTKLSTSLS
jgi:signal transduction histidine kinase